MTSRTHDLFAFTGVTLIIASGMTPHMTLGTAAVAGMAVFLGGLAPDLDEPSSALWQRLPAGAGTILGRIVAPVFGSHRFISHSLVGLWLYGMLAKIMLAWMATFVLVDMTIVWWAFMLGLGSHLVADALTKEGIPLLWPIPIKFGFPPLTMIRVKTGEWMEKLVVFPGLIVLNGWIIYHQYQVFLGFVKNLK